MPPERLVDFAATWGLTLLAPCTGGHISSVWTARWGTDTVVLKTDVCPPDAPPWRRALSDLSPEADWLARHRWAPAVLGLDDGVLVLEHLPYHDLEADQPAFDPAREAAWVAAAVAATGPPSGAPHLLDPVTFAVTRLRERGDLGDKQDRLDAWLSWAGTQASEGTVAFDVLPQNTLASPDRWYAIDPWPVTGPAAVVGTSWALARGVRDERAASFGVHPDHLARTTELLGGFPDPDASARWMPAACAWWLFWPGQYRHRAYPAVADQLTWWLDAHPGL